LQQHALQDKPATPPSLSHPLYHPPCPTEALLWTPQAPNQPTLIPLGFKAADHPSPSFLAHSALLTLPYQFLCPDLKLSTCAAKENGFHDRVL
jgi:hypothetical protein